MTEEAGRPTDRPDEEKGENGDEYNEEGESRVESGRVGCVEWIGVFGDSLGK